MSSHRQSISTVAQLVRSSGHWCLAMCFLSNKVSSLAAFLRTRSVSSFIYVSGIVAEGRMNLVSGRASQRFLWTFGERPAGWRPSGTTHEPRSTRPANKSSVASQRSEPIFIKLKRRGTGTWTTWTASLLFIFDTFARDSSVEITGFCFEGAALLD